MSITSKPKPFLAGVALVHLQQVAGEQGRLLAAGARPDFQQHRGDRRLLVGQHRVGGRLQQLAPLLLQFGQFLAGHVLEVPVRRAVRQDRLVVLDLLADLLELLVGLDEPPQPALLLQQRGHLGRVARHRRVAHLLAERVVALRQFPQPVQQLRFEFVEFFGHGLTSAPMRVESGVPSPVPGQPAIWRPTVTFRA